MADKKITQLTDGGAPQATDEFVVARAGDNFKIDFAAIDSNLLDQAVILAPASSARNVIQPTAGAVIAAIVKAHATQSVDLTQWQSSAGTPLLSVGFDGVLNVRRGEIQNAGFLLSRTQAAFNQSGILLIDDGTSVGVKFNVYNDPAWGLEFSLMDKSGPGVNDLPIFYEAIAGGNAYSGALQLLSHNGLTPMTGAKFSIFGSDGVNYGGGQQTAATLAQLWAALKLWGFLNAASAAPTVYVPGGTDVALADGGTGASLVDPNADRIFFWDDSAGSTAFLTAGTGLTITGTTIDATAGAPTAATYITQTPDAGLSAEQALSALATGLLKSTTATGVLSIAAQGTDYYAPGGTDVAVADGGTGSSTAAGARTNLDVPSNAEAVLDTLFDANTVLAADTDNTPAAVTMAASTILARLASGNIKAASVAEIITLLQAYTVGGTDVAVTDGGTGSSTAAGARTNLDVPSNAEAILDAIVDAKGDLIAATAADTVARLAVGADETLALVPDSSQATGLKYAVPSAFAGRGYKSSRYYVAGEIGMLSGTAIPAEARVYAMRFYCRKTTTFDRISTWQTGVGTAGAVVRMGIYADDGNVYPGALVLDAGTFDATGANVAKAITISQSLTRGLYWAVAVVQGAAGTRPTLSVATMTSGIAPSEIGAPGIWENALAYYADSVTGALGTPFNTTPLTIGTAPAIWLRAA